MTEKQKNNFCIIFLFLLNFCFALIFLNQGIFHVDGVITAEAVEKTLQTKALQPALQYRYGLVFINSILYLPFYLMGKSAEFSILLSGAFFHSLSIVALFLFVKELFQDRMQALFSALFLSFTPFYFMANSFGKEQGMSLTFLLLSFYLLVKGIKKDALVYIGLASAIYAFSLSVRESLLVFVPFFFLLYIQPNISIRPLKLAFPEKTWELRRVLTLSLPFISLFSLIFGNYLGEVIIKTLAAQNSSFYVSFLGFFSPFLPVALRDLFLAVPILLIFISLIGVREVLINKGIFLAIFFVAWFLLLFYFGNTSTYAPRFLDVVSIPIYILSSYVLARLFHINRPVVLSIVSFVVISMIVFMYPMLSFRHNFNGQKNFALFVKTKTPLKSFIIAQDEALFIRYYGKRHTISPPVENSNKLNDFIKYIKSITDKKIPVYLVESTFAYDTRFYLRRTLSDNFKITLAGESENEDFHCAELKFQLFKEKLFVLEAKG